MESPGSPNASSGDAPLELPIHEDKEKVTYTRILVSNTAAGCIIGKGGSTISEFQSQSGARIQLSRTQEYFPGTSERIILISGAFDQIIKALELICEKLLAEVDNTGDVDNTLKVKLIVPNSCCGGIIGKGGATIKSLIEDSHAGIKISPQDQSYVGLTDRIVTLSGILKEQMQAFVLILSKLVEDSHYSHFVNTPYPYAGANMSGFHGMPVGYMVPSVPYNSVNYGTNGNAGKYSNNKAVRSPGEPDGAGSSVTIGVADEHIGAVLGRGGKSIMEITQASGARIKISDRGDFMTGTSDRKVTITGSQEAIRTAESLIMQKVSSSSER